MSKRLASKSLVKLIPQELKRVFTMLSLLVVLVWLILPHAALGAASGTISMNIDTDETGKITSVQGTTLLASDDTSWWDIVWWYGTYAQIECHVDGQFRHKVMEITYRRGPNPISELGEEKNFNYWPSLTAGEHTVEYQMRDVYSGERYTSGGCRREVGNIITEYCVHVFVDGQGNKYEQPIEKMNLGFKREQCGNMKGEPINIGTGNSFQEETDLSFSGVGSPLTFKRAYNSRSTYSGPLGFGWTHNYDVNLTETDTLHIEIKRGDGGVSLFIKNPEETYQEVSSQPTYIEELIVDEVRTGWRWHHRDGSAYKFNAGGRLEKIIKNGNETVLTYNVNGRLETVTDVGSGRGFQFTYNDQGLLTQISGPVTAAVPSGIWASYGYDSNHNLISVTYADGSGFNYGYTDINDVHNLTGKQDKMNHSLSSWTYDDQDRAVENVARDGQGVSIGYVSHNTAEVTDTYGSTRTYRLSTLKGYQMFKNVEGESSCPHCGSNVVRRQYDNELRLIEIEYANGLINQYDDFDSQGNAQTLRQAVGTPYVMLRLVFVRTPIFGVLDRSGTTMEISVIIELFLIVQRELIRTFRNAYTCHQSK
jgi:hypothetical protein